MPTHSYAPPLANYQHIIVINHPNLIRSPNSPSPRPAMSAFVPPAPMLRQSTFVKRVQSAPPPTTTVMVLPPPAARAARAWLRSITASLPFRQKRANDYRTMTEITTTIPDLRAKVVALRSVSAAADHMQLSLEVPSQVRHLRPGQFVRLATLSGRPAACIAVIASPPGAQHLDFLIRTDSDPARILSSRVGHRIAISKVMGDGLEHDHFERSDGDLFAFADSPQGFAALKSLLEWGKFRAITGEGANRINHVTIYYSILGGRSVPYADRFSGWSVYGVNVVPLVGRSLTEYLSVNAALGTPKKNLASDFALACVSTEETFETLFCTLVLCGFLRKAIHKFSSEDVLLQSQDEGSDGEDARESFEHGVWASWVRVREGMREEFEQRWAARARQDRDQRRQREEKEQAWASWSAHNREQWTRVQWDDQAWGAYWRSWEDTNGRWTNNDASWKQEADQQRKQWNQQSSQEYWDWVGRGASRSGSAGPGSSGQGHSNRYGGSSSYGNANNRNTWERGGYKYQYEEDNGEKKRGRNYTGGARSNGAGGGAGTGGWSGWNRGSERRARNESTRNWASGGSQELDFYAVLGINSGASKTEIKKAYRKKAMLHHPDRNPDDLEAAHVKMKQIVVAWTVLKDDAKRSRYDAFGSTGP